VTRKKKKKKEKKNKTTERACVLANDGKATKTGGWEPAKRELDDEQWASPPRLTGMSERGVAWSRGIRPLGGGATKAAAAPLVALIECDAA
jgi:hypothetical protein